MSYLPITHTLTINNVQAPLKVASNQNDIQIGMMGATTMKYALAFMLDTGYHSFWMKDCLIPLDILFCLGNEITYIHHNAQPCLQISRVEPERCDRYTGFGNLAIELPGGTCRKHNIKAGDKIHISLN